MTQIEPLYDKACECLICKKPFTSKKIRSRFIKINGYDTDFLPLYHSNEVNPIFYYIYVCPNCGFSFSDETLKSFPPSSKKDIEDKVCSKWAPQNYGGKRTIEQAITTYKLAIYCAALKKEKHINLAGMYLRIAWLYRIMPNIEQEQRFMKLALMEYEESNKTDDFRGTQMSEFKLLYLTGELSRKTNKTEQAIYYFSKVIERQRQSVEPKIIEMARERWQEIRESRTVHLG